MLDNTPAMVYTYEVDEEGRNPTCPFASAGCHAVFGLTAREVLEEPQKLWSGIHPDDAAGCRDSILESKKTLQMWKHSWRHFVNGEYRQIACSTTPVRLSDSGRTRW